LATPARARFISSQALSADKVVIRRHDARAGTVHVHFPRIGFQIKEQQP